MPQPVRLPTVVVRGLAFPTPSLLDGADRTRITAQELEQQQAVTLVDALRRIPGVDMIQSGGIGQPANVSLRGTATGQTAVILDGMRINDVSADNGAVDLAPWRVDDMAEIQVIRGPLSSLYGSDAMGGAIVLETKKGGGLAKIRGKAEAGSYQTYSQVLSTQGQKGSLDYHITASRLQSNGSPLMPDRFRGRIQGKADDPLHQENISARFGVGQESANLSFLSRYTTRRLGFRGGQGEPWRQKLSQSFNRLQGHLEGLEGKWIHDIGIGHYQTDRENENSLGQKDGENNGSQAQADWRQTLTINERVQANVATDLAQEQFYTHRLNSDSNQARSNRGGVSAALATRVIEPLTISTAARIDKYQGLPIFTTYRIGGEYHYYGFIFKGGIGTGFKAPTLAQRFYRSPLFWGNPHLKPEKSLGWDFGIERSFFSQRFNLGIVHFQNRIRDMIGFGQNTNININRAQTQGFEAFAKFHMTQAWSVELTHTYTRAWDTFTKLGLVRRPRNKTTFRVNGQITPEWQVSGTVFYVGQQPDLDFQNNLSRRIRMPSSTIFGAETSYQLTNQWQIYGRGENLLNRRYEAPNGYQQPGLGLYAGVRVQW
ncbi:MAG: hypothetical protein K0R76_934 [Alphaproteobacteria bacterium]|nr:hypothetical protein [Alphaproteobacteria bacterium]